ncbi:MAG: alcohol dehydrogenase catalytic domain-containing protein [Armatimonadia bacterium]|nr:alcohol dehydrogenase catalytic domain-containing protein [Armatimonadia bacterium]
MTTIPESCRAIVFDPADRSLDIRQLPMRPLRRGEVLVRVRLSAICGSDLHTIRGRRDPGGPLVLGHEIVGDVAALGEGVDSDCLGAPLSVGDRITWGIAAGCGRCFLCANGLPQKCVELFKYGHQPLDSDTPLSGGFAEYCYLVPGTAYYRLPDDLPDPIAVFANCSLATMQAAMRLANLRPGESVLVQGAGLVGMCAMALSAHRRAKPIVAVDPSEHRLNQAGYFGASHMAGEDEMDDGLVGELREATEDRRGFDVAIEACGVPSVVRDGIKALRTGGRYVLAGCVYPDATTDIDLNDLIRKVLTLQGLHNYTPHDLQEALRFLQHGRQRFSFGSVVRKVFPLAEIDAALELMERDPSVLRVALSP